MEDPFVSYHLSCGSERIDAFLTSVTYLSSGRVPCTSALCPPTQRTASRSLRLPPSSCEAGSERLTPPSSSPDNVLISPDIVTRVSSVRARDQQTARGNRRSPGGSRLYIRMTADLLTNETPKFYDVTSLVLSYTFAENFFLICL